MERQEVENQIKELVYQIRDIVWEYCPEDKYLNIVLYGDYMAVNNEHWREDHKHPICFWKFS